MPELDDRITGDDDQEKVNCPDCGGDGKRQVPIMDDWGDVEYHTEVTCSFCGGSGKFYADQAGELKAEGVWYDSYGSEDGMY